MNLSTLLELPATGLAERPAITSGDVMITYEELLERSARVAGWLQSREVEHLAYLDVNSEALPVAVFASARAGLPFVPLNYRLTDDQLRATLERVAPAVTLLDINTAERLGPVPGIEYVDRDAFLAASETGGPGQVPSETDAGDGPAWLLFTSGTSGAPKAAVLRHQHLTSYVLGTVPCMGASGDEASLVSVPPYHVAGLMAVLSGVYAGRRLVYLPAFDEREWVRCVREQDVTHAMVVPTMLRRILDALEDDAGGLPSLRSISYGGGRMPVPVIERALELLPGVDFVNGYGLTETSSTIAVLTAEDHREAVSSDDPAVRRRLGSVGRPLPTVEVEIRSEEGEPLPPNHAGEIWVRGEQVSGEYLGRGAVTQEGWLATRDHGWVDEEGYLYVEGRLDDVIVRGGENMSPGEIEEVLLRHPQVAEAAVVGVPDEQWGERVAAFVVPTADEPPEADELREWVRERLRSSRVPEDVEFRPALPYTSTGKLLRRALREDVTAEAHT